MIGTETLELIPRQWKVIQHVREKYSCRTCEAITQPPAPSHPIARGRAGPSLLAHILFSKYGLHLPLNRQSKVYAREGIELDPSQALASDARLRSLPMPACGPDRERPSRLCFQAVLPFVELIASDAQLKCELRSWLLIKLK